MLRRYKNILAGVPTIQLKPAFALREVLRRGYTLEDFRSDLLAGAVVALIAIPLSMALAIATGVPPQNGLYTLIIAGILVALLGGSRWQVTGPTAAFVVILAPIVEKHGIQGLLLSGFLAGIILLVMGAARLGQLIEFIPYPVTTGFTAGIAVVIASIQVKDFLGLTFVRTPDTFFSRISIIIESLPSFSVVEFLIGSCTLFLIIAWPKANWIRVNHKIPAPLVALCATTIGFTLLQKFFPDLKFATIHNRFSTEVAGTLVNGIPGVLPTFAIPWSSLNWPYIESLLPAAFAIAMLGAIESLLSAVVADGMAQTKHDPDAELIALGVGNLVCPFFGGIAATGAIARTATNIRYGARSPFSVVIHSVLTILALLFFSPYISLIPMASLAALLLIVAYNMAGLKHVVHILRVSPTPDVIIFIICFALTTIYDMVVGVTVGVVLASFLFMKRMAALTSVKLVGSQSDQMGHPLGPLPQGTIIYQIAGPLFFGAANKAIETIDSVDKKVTTVIFDLSQVPAMDATGLVALESAITNLRNRKTRAILADVQSQPKSVIDHADLLARHEDVTFAENVEVAVKLVRDR